MPKPDDRASFEGLSDRQLLETVVSRIGRLEQMLGGAESGVLGRIRRLDTQMSALFRLAMLDIDQLPFPERLTACRFPYLSQNGEEGITLAVFRAAGLNGSRLVEIGCGSNGGNSGFLVKECGWSAMLIDGSEDCIARIGARFAGCKVTSVQSYVTTANVNDLLQQKGFGEDVDVLSIDIDGNDYWIWDALLVAPRLVIMEYNSLFGPERAVTIQYQPDFNRFKRDSAYYGASLAALEKLARHKGYRLITTEPAGVNAYFLRNDIGPEIPEVSVADAFRYQEKHLRARRDIFSLAATNGWPLVDV